MNTTDRGTTSGTNRKKLLLPTTMSRAGWAIVEAREDVEGVPYQYTVSKAELHRLLEDVAGVALGVQPFSDPELDAAPGLEVVSRIGVGYDAVDVPALTRRKIPLMIGGTANSVSVAEAGVFLIMSLARRGAAMDALVKEGRWHDRYKEMPADLYGKTVLIVGFGKIGTRSAKRFAAMETNVLVYDPYMYSETIRGMGYEPVGDLDAAVARADFITIHCPKTPETVGMFDAARLGHMKRTAFIVNTARGGIVDERALYDALKANRIAGAALDVFVEEPTPQDNPLLTLPNFIAAPHVAGVTREAVDRMGAAAVENILSVLDGKPNRENVVNREVLG
ncbi:MAG TPA: hydroxyacid dehydrogenase [Stellaceae bacterium]|nr:hydroxyacid dehydrogenase [Stellaceae bacterium]